MRRDLLDEPVREPLRIGDVAVIAATVPPGEFEQAAERARRVAVLVAEGEALARPALLALAGLPVVLGAVRDLRQRPEGGLDSLRVPAELRQDGRERVRARLLAWEDRAVVAADAVGDRVQRLPVVVRPLDREHVVHHLAGIGREARGVLGPFGQPGCGQVGKQRFPLSDLHEGGRAGEREPARREQFLRSLRQSE